MPTQRLRKLEALDVVERRRVKGGWEYHLTQAGEELRPVVVGLGHWGARWMLHVLGAGRRGQTLWQWLGRSMFAPTRIAVRL